MLSACAWSHGAFAQSDTPPVAPTPAPPEPSTPPPSDVAPPPDTAPPSAPEPPAATPPAGPAPPPSGSFPAPAPPPVTAPPAATPHPARVAAPPEATPAPPPAPVGEKPRPKRPTEGLFEEKGPPAPVHHHEDENEDEDTDHFKIGPVVGTGIPSVISFGGTLKLTRYLGAGVNVGLIPKVQLSYYGDATLSYQHYDIYGRLDPFGGGFFLGAGAGYATVDGTVTKTFALPAAYGGSVRYDNVGTVRTLMLTALIGYFYTTSIGFSFGVDAGAQIPIAPSQIHNSSTLSGEIPAAYLAKAKEDYLTPTDQSVRDTLEKIGRTTLPTVNLRIGWIL